MVTSASPQRTITEADLRLQGFTASQIAMLVELRDAYPFAEFTDSRAELSRLRFVRWRYMTGRTSEWTLSPSPPP